MMTIEAFRKRCLARLTALPEILYALTRHWFILSLFLSVGTGLMVAKVSTDPVVYSGKAILAINSSEALVPETEAPSGPREDAGKFFTSRVEMLQNDSVLRKVVQELKTTSVLSQEDNKEAESYGPVRSVIQEVKTKISGLLSYLEHPTALDQSLDLDIQRAISAFRRRSIVEPNFRTNTVKIQVLGNNRELIAKELDSWYNAYRNRLLDMSGEVPELYYGSQIQLYQRQEKEAQETLDKFKKENPEVSKVALDLLLAQIMRLEYRREDLMRERDDPSHQVQAPPEVSKQDPQMRALEAKKLEYEGALLEKISLFGESSTEADDVRKRIKAVEEKLGTLGGPAVAKDPLLRQQQIAAQIADLGSTITEYRTRHAAMSGLVSELELHERELQDARKTHQNYLNLQRGQRDFIAAAKLQQVTLVERPSVGWQPFETYPYRQILFGALGGLALGVICALLLELMTGKARFKNDIYTEFGVPVIGVIPRK